MKIKPPIYFAAALLGVAALFLAPQWLGREVGLALGFALLLFGLYGMSSRIPSGKDKKDSDHGL